MHQLTKESNRGFTGAEVVLALRDSAFPDLHAHMIPRVVAAVQEALGAHDVYRHGSSEDLSFRNAAYEALAGDPDRWNIFGPIRPKWWI